MASLRRRRSAGKPPAVPCARPLEVSDGVHCRPDEGRRPPGARAEAGRRPAGRVARAAPPRGRCRIRGGALPLERDDRPPARSRCPLHRRRRRGRRRAVRPRERHRPVHEGRRPQHLRPGGGRGRPDARPLPDAGGLGRPPVPDRPCAGGLPPRRRRSGDAAARAGGRSRLRLRHRHRGADPGRRLRVHLAPVRVDERQRPFDGRRDRRRPPRARQRGREPRPLLGPARRRRELRRLDGCGVRPPPVRPRGLRGRRGVARRGGPRGPRDVPQRRRRRRRRS